MQADAVWEKSYVNSPQFESLTRERAGDISKTIAPSLIPTKLLTKKGQEVKKSHKDFRSIFNFTAPSTIYASVLSDTRGDLIPNPVLMTAVNEFYNSKFEKNLTAVYKYSPAFYHKSLYTKIDGVEKPDQSSFMTYEKYIYIISLIVYVNQHREALKGDLDTDAPAILNWAQLRNDSAFTWILEGPSDTYSIPTNFKEQYASIISTASHASNILEQNKLSKMNMLYSELTTFKDEASARPNSYNKELDEARQYYLVVRDEEGLGFELDDKENLIFDASYLDLGDTTNNKTFAEYNSIKVEQDKHIGTPSRITFKAIQQLFTTFNSISIKDFTIDYSLYAVDLSKFLTVYLVFPGIQTAEHTIIGNTPRGTLYIAGRFENDENRRKYIFKPNEDITTFDGSQTIVKNMQFYLTTSLDGSNSIIANSIIQNFTRGEVFNHLLKNTLNTESLVPTDYGRLIVRSDKVRYDLPNELSKINKNDLPELKNYISKLEFVPYIVTKYMENFEYIYDRYITLSSGIVRGTRSSMDELTAESLISSNQSTEFEEMISISKEFKQMSLLTKILNDELSKYRIVKLNQLDPMKIQRQLISESDNPIYRDLCKSASTVSYETIRDFFIKLCRLRFEEVIPLNTEIETSKDTYISIFLHAIDILIGSAVKDNPRDLIIEVDIFHGGFIDGMKFRYEPNGPNEKSLEFVYNSKDASAKYDFISDEDNDVVLIRLWNDSTVTSGISGTNRINGTNTNNSTNSTNSTNKLNQTTSSSSNSSVSSGAYPTQVSSGNFVYALQKKLMQRLPGNVENVLAITQLPLYDDNYQILRELTTDIDGYYYRSGGFEQVSIDSIKDDGRYYYANITNYLTTYKVYTFSPANAPRYLSVIRYLPEQFMNESLFNEPIFKFYDDYLSLGVSTSRILRIKVPDHDEIIVANSTSFISTISTDNLATTNLVIDDDIYTVTLSLSDVSDYSNYSNYSKKFSVVHSEGFFNFSFYLDSESKVRRIEISKFMSFDDTPVIENTQYILGDLSNVPFVIILDPNTYSIRVRDPNIDYSCEVKTVPRALLNSDKYSYLFATDNMYKCYSCYDNAIQKYWDNTIHGRALSATPLIWNSTPSELGAGNQIWNASTSTSIYTINDEGIRIPYKLMYTLAGIPGVTLDNKYTTDAIVYVSEILSRNYGMISPEYTISGSPVTITLTSRDDTENTWYTRMPLSETLVIILNLDLSNDRKYVKEVKIGSVTLRGAFESSKYYIFNESQYDGESHGIISFTLEYETIEDGNIKMRDISVFFSEKTMKKYTFTSEGSTVETLPCFYLNRESIYERADTIMDISQLSLSLVNGLGYHKVLPYFKYSQDNFVNKIYTNDENVELTIINKSNLGKHLMGTIMKRLRRETVIGDDEKNADEIMRMDVSATLPYNEQHLMESIDDKVIVTNVKNERVEDAITVSSGIINVSRNDLIYMSMNVK